jgi:hypothetical protein
MPSGLAELHVLARVAMSHARETSPMAMKHAVPEAGVLRGAVAGGPC